MVTSTLHKGPHPTPTPTTQVKPTSTPSPPKPGFCAKYDRPPCQDILRQSWTQFNETERYFDSKLGINGSEHFLSILLEESGRQIKNDPRCKWLIEVSLCQYTLSPCMSDGNPVSLCREDCESLTKECKVFLNRIIGSADILTNIKKYDFAHLVLPTNCSYYPSGKTGNHSCVYIGLFGKYMFATVMVYYSVILLYTVQDYIFFTTFSRSFKDEFKNKPRNFMDFYWSWLGIPPYPSFHNYPNML
jgi:hypothetical protein